MKLKTSISLMIAVVLGLVTAKVGLDMLKSYGARSGPAMRVVTAKHDMEPGYVITANDVKLEQIPASLARDKMIRETQSAVGRTVVATVAGGFPLTDSVLAPAGAGAGLQALVPKGYRAVTVDVGDSGSVGGLLTPGCRVDVIATLRMGEQTVARTVVENVKVQFVQRVRSVRQSNPNFAPDSASGGDSGPVKTVTLLVTPREAAAIELASAEGKPRLVLRGSSDQSTSEQASITRRELLGLPPVPDPQPDPPPAAQPAPPTDAFGQTPPVDSSPGRTVEIIRGGTTSTVTMDEEGSKTQDGGNSAAPSAPPRKQAGNEPGEASRKMSAMGSDRAPRKQATGGN